MAGQLLQVIKDPSIVNNVPTTPAEQLQLATEKKAAEMAKQRSGAYSETGSISSMFDPIGPGFGPSGGWPQFDDQFNSSTPTARTAETQVPGLPASGAGYGAGTTKGASVRLMPSLSYADAFGQAYGAKPASGLSAIERATSNGGGSDPTGAGPGMWADLVDMFGGGFLNGDPGTTVNPHDGGLFGVPATGFATQGNAPTPAPSSGSGGSSIGAMFGDPVTLASGTHSTVGATGTAQDGRYSYVVQPGGAIAKTINPFTPAAAAQRAADMASVTQSKGFPGSGIY